ncbi:hypothetical protein KP509_29G083600 [Ceratopteris richardii]|uniref:Uncharacterized protein n=1 Tax=Ceratopteris richardii TaxID=49495 RepID=A0A8T2R8K2_CERRI|nr:hypothetical protein KP509_29G083600 [Ceratopteris richardii]
MFFLKTQSTLDYCIVTLTFNPMSRRQLCYMKSKNEEKAKALDLSWRKFFADPSCWWDIRYNKRKRSSPDFVHCITREALFADSWLNPLGVEAQLLALENQRGNFPARAKYASGRHSNCIAFYRDFNNETFFWRATNR